MLGVELVVLALGLSVALADSNYGQFHGRYGGRCDRDGFYYKDQGSMVICSNNNAYVQPCAPGTRNSNYNSYNRGGHYHYRDFCDVNLVDHGYGVRHGGRHGDQSYGNSYGHSYGNSYGQGTSYTQDHGHDNSYGHAGQNLYNGGHKGSIRQFAHGGSYGHKEHGHASFDNVHSHEHDKSYSSGGVHGKHGNSYSTSGH